MGFKSSSMKRRNDCRFRVLVRVDSIVLTGFVQRRCCLVELWCWRDYKLVPIWFLLCFFFFFIFAYWHLFSFFPWRWKWGGDFVSALWFCLKIMNLVLWIEDMSSLVMALFCWMHISIQHDWFNLMLLERARCVDAPCWR